VSEKVEDVLDGKNRKTDFNKDEFRKVWFDFIESLKDESPRLYNTMYSLKYSINEGFIIEFEVSNMLLEKAVLDKTNEIHAFLRNHLENDLITIKTKLTEKTDESKIIYTSEDKFKHMAKKNPKLLDFKKDLNLDFD